ncbi:MAG: cyclic nucleotide-binding domain-containing protein [Deltaproteobacteria bacterium]|nr:cyclic nucleotide-binding domain-containing protein [Deltaproteobacteria bacterium]
MLPVISENRYYDGEIIFEDGNFGDWVFQILKGKVEIFKVIQGHEVIVDVLQDNELLGEMGFIDKFPRSASARAVGETCLGLIDKDYLDREFNKIPSEFRKLLVTLVKRLRKTTNTIEKFIKSGETQQKTTPVVELLTDEQFEQAVNLNVAGGEFFIASQRPLDLGSKLIVKFKPTGAPDILMAEAMVIWARIKDDDNPHLPPGMGIKINKLMRAEDKKIVSYPIKLTIRGN